MAEFTDVSDAKIPKFYAGRSLFITGGTGFVGKILVERLLSTCPDIGAIFLLVRQKRQQSAETRLQELTQSRVFDEIRARCPSQLNKIRVIPGDVTLPNLGVSEQSRAELQEVSVVFHVAATLKFEEPLATAVSFNVRPVVALMDLCDKLPNIKRATLTIRIFYGGSEVSSEVSSLAALGGTARTKVLIHVSTAYSYSDLQHIEERIYDPPVPLASLLAVTESLPEDLISVITPGYISPKPNTYTFTKAMAEHVVASHKRNGYLAAICRPSILIATKALPFPGWVDNFAGPSGIIAAAGCGLMHVMLGRGDAAADMLPADIAADALIAAAAEVYAEQPASVRVYNICSGASAPTWRQFEKGLRYTLHRHPFQRAMWRPGGVLTDNFYLHRFLVMLLQTIPMHFAEYSAKLLGIKMPLSLIATERRIHAMTDVLAFFSLREWKFDTNNMTRLWANMSPADKQLYNIDPSSIDWDKQYISFVNGTRKYLLKEKDDKESRQEAFRRRNILTVVHYSLLIFIFILILRVVFKTNVLGEVVRFFYSMAHSSVSKI